MTTSGTTAFNLDLNNLIEEAFERAGAELRTGYEMRTAPYLLQKWGIEMEIPSQLRGPGGEGAGAGGFGSVRPGNSK